nr:protein arginine N-methyltransferase 1 [Onthophagus taurus]
MGDSDVPKLADFPSNQNDEDSDGWDEMEATGGEQTTCLFCSSQFHTIAVALDHCRTEHNFDLLDLKTKYNMDCYSFIKMINYIRKHKPEPKTITESCSVLWEDDEYLKPGEMESWLMYDFDDLGSAPSTPHYAIDGKTPISNITYADLQRQIQDLTVQLKHKDSLLQTAMEDISKMRQITRTIIEAGDEKLANSSKINCVGSIPVGYDSEYFNSYAHFGIHHDMLNDKVRTESYRDAILKNSALFSGKTVLDVGCGTGILSMFAAKAGANKVYGIDQSDVVYKAMEIVRENNLHEIIHLIHGRLEDTQLPEEKVDIIVSEWMGYFLLFEGMLDSFIHARDTHLKPNGLVLPSKCTINLIGGSDLERYKKYIDFWDDVYGFNMKCMKSEVLGEANIETLSNEHVLTESCVLKEINLRDCTTSTPNFSANFELKCLKKGVLTCFVGYFDTFFELENLVTFSTGPEVERTHWQQTIFYLKNVINVEEGDVIRGTLNCSRMLKNVRGLKVSIVIGDDKYEYRLD